MAPGSRFDREVVKGENRYYHLVLLAENNAGIPATSVKIVITVATRRAIIINRVWTWRCWRNTMRVSLHFRHAWLVRLRLTCVRSSMRKQKKQHCRHLKIFGEGNYYPGDAGSWHPGSAYRQYAGVMRLSKETGIPMVVTNDSHYIICIEDWEAHDILLCIQTGKERSHDEDRMRYAGRTVSI